MKTLKHTRSSSAICIYEHTEEKIRGSFFNEKPLVGDVIESFNKKAVYEVVEIVENRDGRVKKDAIQNPSKAYFELIIKKVEPTF